MKVSFFRAPVTHVQPVLEIEPEQVYSYIISPRAYDATLTIRNAEPSQRGNLKKSSLDFITPCGTFTKRNITGLKSVSGIMVLDIDHYSRPLDLIQEVTPSLQPLVAFVSPSGEGVKFLVDVTADYIKKGWTSFDQPIMDAALRQQAGSIYKQIYQEASQGWNEAFPDAPLDMSGSDITRACFLPHNELAYIAPSLFLKLLRRVSR